MLLTNNEMRSLKGYILSELLVSKRTYITGACIIFANLFIAIVLQVIMLSTGQDSSNNGGPLVVGSGVAYIVMLISSILISQKKILKTKFLFPINRKIYTLGNFIVFCINTFILLLITCNAYLLEILSSLILKSIYKDFVYINQITFDSFSIGFIMSVLYIVALTVFTYLLFIVIFRYGLKSIITLSTAIAILLIFPFGRNLLFGIIMFFAGEQSAPLLAVKLIGCALILQILSYLPLKSMEVSQ
ncbi:MAG TPA: hypothetical protein VIO64_05815 [Pseudobacteroides sp.]|uniref:hypothetical protein n=1 Tax=Pseudobacteroides sp. TaxID=1968840 RepID=UPI002F92D629